MNTPLKIPVIRAALVLAMTAIGGAAVAHHSARITYDMDTVIEIQGEITGVTWVNPHVRFTLGSVDEDNELVTWNVESIPVTRLNRVGITREMLGVGDTVTVAAYPARRPVRNAYAINMLLADGREALLDTPVPRWSDNTVGTGLDETPGTPGADPSLGLFRVWSTDGSFLRTETRFLTEGGTLDYPLTDAARAAQAAWDPLDPDNPFLTCIPKGMPTIMQQPNPVEFIDEGDRIVFLLEEFDAIRVIHMSDDADGQDAPPSRMGYSTGYWEGGTLMVRTSRINWPYFDQNGLPQSEAVETVERFTVNGEGSRLDYELVVTDPWLFTEPVTFGKSWRWIPGDAVLPFNCADN
ncbi:MAG: hypothetical protein F4181_00110 [Proteobacteria bacterium]|nr:hypothetical protein [Pseudomonadota bacterium]